MGWGLVRIGIFSIAFLVGLTVAGPSRKSVGGASKHFGGDPAAVQLQCTKETVVIVRGGSPQVWRYVVGKIGKRNFD